MLKVWRLMAHHENPEAVVKWFREKKRIAIGWGRVGDIAGENYASPKEIVEVTKVQYPTNANIPFSGTQLWNFCYNIKPKDLVIVSTGKRRALVMRVTGNYEYVTPDKTPPLDKRDYQHQREAEITEIDPDRLWSLAGAKTVKGETIRWTLIQCLKSVDIGNL